MGGETHPRISSPTPSDYLAVMSRAVFQAGLSWAAIDRQWDQLQAAFDGFAPQTVARYRERDVRRIMAHPGILHSERKIHATIHNAQALLDAQCEFGSVRAWLRSHRRYDDVVADIKRRFSNVGDISAYYLLFRCGEKVPPFERWIKTVKGDHPRIREMVAAARR